MSKFQRIFLIFRNLILGLRPRSARSAVSKLILALFFLIILQENRDKQAIANDFIDIYLDRVERSTRAADSAGPDSSLAAGSGPESSFYGQKGLQSLEIVLVDLFIGGSETTATSINWTILYLLHYPQVQDKIHAELDRIVGRSRWHFFFSFSFFPSCPLI